MTTPSTDLTTAAPTGLAVLDDPDGLQMVRDTLAGVDSILSILPRATITGTGPAAFTVGGESVKTIRGVIVHAEYSRAYWEKEYDGGGGDQPDCQSLDGRTGVGTPGGSCATCPLNQFVDGKGKPCSEGWTLAVLPEDDLIPVLVSVPAASIKPWMQFKTSLGLRAPRFRPEQVVATLSVTQVNTRNRSGVNQIQFHCDKATDALSSEAQQRMAAYVESVRPALQRQMQDDGGRITPQDGDIDAQAAA